MKVLCLSNNKISDPLFEWLKKTEEVILLQEKLSLALFLSISPDIVISYNYKYIVKKNILDLLPNKFINLHISLLPWNRGAYPNIWSIIKNTPKGVTIHLMDEGIDTGDIIVQKEVEISEEETLLSSYNILHTKIQELFIESWDSIKNNNINLIKQDYNNGSIHYIKDFEKITEQHSLENLWSLKIKDFKKILNR